MKKQLLELSINGRSQEIAIEANKLLLDALRQELQLTGSKRGCDDSSCGACTVLIDGPPMLSCMLLAASCEGQEITTVEGVSQRFGCNPKSVRRLGRGTVRILYSWIHDDSETFARYESEPERWRDS